MYFFASDVIHSDDCGKETAAFIVDFVMLYLYGHCTELPVQSAKFVYVWLCGVIEKKENENVVSRAKTLVCAIYRRSVDVRALAIRGTNRHFARG